MRIAILIVLLNLISYHPVQAQWYYRSACGVTDIYDCTSEQYDCLLADAMRISDFGRRWTKNATWGVVAGIGLIVVGIPFGGDFFSEITMLGLFVSAVCLPQYLWTIPVWIFGNARVRQIKNVMYFGSLEGMALRVKPSLVDIPLCQRPAVGFGVSFTF